LVASLNSLTNYENPTINPLQEAFPAYDTVAAFDSKLVPKATGDSEHCSECR
jgi:hypothetical protein